MCDDDGALIDSGTFDSALDHGWGIRVEGRCPDARLVAAGEVIAERRSSTAFRADDAGAA